MHYLVLTVEAILFASVGVALLAAIGFGIVELLWPGHDLRLLLAPAVGLAVLAIGFAWATLWVKPSVAAIGVLVITLPLSAWTWWRRRAAAADAWHDITGAGAVATVLFVALMQIDLSRGFFTLGGFPSDNVFIYAQAAQYLVDHAEPVLRGPAVQSPGSDYLVRIGPAFPNSVGPIDAAVAALLHVPVYAVFDFVSAIALAITVGPVWVFVRRCLAGSWWTALAAACVLATNQLLYWVIGLGFQQESLALPMFASALTLTAMLMRAPTGRGGVLLGVITAAVAGVYLPIAALLVVCAAISAAFALVRLRPVRWRAFAAAAAGAVAGGVIAGGPAIYLLGPRGGLAIWIMLSRLRVAAGAVPSFPLVPYLLGDLPFAHGWSGGRLPLTTYDKIALPLYAAGSALILLLLVLGCARAALRGRGLEASLLIAGMLFVAYEGAVAQYPYGFVKSIGYMMPMTSAFIAFGGVGIEALAPTRVFALARRWGPVAVAVILMASALASFDMIRLWESIPFLPTLPERYIALSSMAGPIPEGSSVLIDYPTENYLVLAEVAAIAYWLPDRDVRVFIGEIRQGTFPDQEVRPNPCNYDYVIGFGLPAQGFSLVYTDPDSELNVYRRGATCKA